MLFQQGLRTYIMHPRNLLSLATEHIMVHLLTLGPSLTSIHTFDGFRGQTFPILFKECIALKRHVELCPTVAYNNHPQCIIIRPGANMIERKFFSHHKFRVDKRIGFATQIAKKSE